MFKTLANAWKIPDLKRKMIFTIVIVLLYRLGACIPVPYVSSDALNYIVTMNSSGSIFDYLNILSGQAFSQATLFALSVSPYITAQIVIQLLTIAIPALEKISKEGEDGRKKLDKITRYVTVVLALVTAYGYYAYMKNLGVLTDKSWFAMLVIIACYCAGAALIMWLADRIDESGIGNGISIILFVNILSSGFATAETIVNQIKKGGFANIFFAILSVIIMVAVITLVVFITNSERRIPVQYAKRVVGRKMYGGQNSNLPLKLNMSGVMPIIFASSILSLPQTISMFWQPESGSVGAHILNLFSQTSVFYIVLYALLILAFAYFYASIQFNPIEIANNLKKNGGFIPGFRPGKPTSDFITKALGKVTFVGALFLAVVALLPLIVGAVNSSLRNVALGGTSVIIVVGVALDTVKQMEAQMLMRHHKGFLE